MLKYKRVGLASATEKKLIGERTVELEKVISSHPSLSLSCVVLMRFLLAESE